MSTHRWFVTGSSAAILVGALLAPAGARAQGGDLGFGAGTLDAAASARGDTSDVDAQAEPDGDGKRERGDKHKKGDDGARERAHRDGERDRRGQQDGARSRDRRDGPEQQILSELRRIRERLEEIRDGRRDARSRVEPRGDRREQPQGRRHEMRKGERGERHGDRRDEFFFRYVPHPPGDDDGPMPGPRMGRVPPPFMMVLRELHEIRMILSDIRDMLRERGGRGPEGHGSRQACPEGRRGERSARGPERGQERREDARPSERGGRHHDDRGRGRHDEDDGESPEEASF